MRKKVLITGGAGFIAHHLIDFLLRETDWEIISLDRLDFSGNLNRIFEVAAQYPEIERKRIKIVHHDLKAEINEHVASFLDKPDIILHLAAASTVNRSITHPLEFIYDNVVGTANLLEYARRLDNLETFHYFGTDEIFGPAPKGVDYKERDRYSSTNPYSASKASAEQLCVAWENTFKMPMIITHCMNVFGYRQQKINVVPLFIDKIDRGEEIIIHSNPERTEAGSRFYIHGDDVAEALYFIITKKPYVPPDYGGAKSQVYNIVGKEEIDNLTLAKLIASAQKKPFRYQLVDFHSSRPGHDLRYSISGELLKSLGWEPKISLTDRIQQVTDWYLKNPRWLGR